MLYIYTHTHIHIYTHTIYIYFGIATLFLFIYSIIWYHPIVIYLGKLIPLFLNFSFSNFNMIGKL